MNNGVGMQKLPQALVAVMGQLLDFSQIKELLTATAAQRDFGHSNRMEARLPLRARALVVSVGMEDHAAKPTLGYVRDVSRHGIGISLSIKLPIDSLVLVAVREAADKPVLLWQLYQIKRRDFESATSHLHGMRLIRDALANEADGVLKGDVDIIMSMLSCLKPAA